MIEIKSTKLTYFWYYFYIKRILIFYWKGIMIVLVGSQKVAAVNQQQPLIFVLTYQAKAGMLF